MKEEKLKSFDEKLLHLYIWDDVKSPKGVLQLVHGSCEYAARYNEWAKFCNQNGWVVIANDHRGHGKTADLVNHELGFFAKHDGWKTIIDDLKVVNDYIRKIYPNLPIVMLGHSMGSFMARSYIIDYSDTIAGVILSGTAWHHPLVLKFGQKVAAKNQKKHGDKHIDHFVFKNSYKPLNKKFNKPGANGNEWLQSNEKNVKAFNDDPLCGFIFTSAGYKDLFTGLLHVQNKKNIRKTRKDLPILLVAGKQDPVGNFSKAVKKTYKVMKKQKLNPELKFYEKSRHEILFDIEKESVMKDTLHFMDNAIKKQSI